MKARRYSPLMAAGMLVLSMGCDSTPELDACRAAGSLGVPPFATRFIPAGAAAPAGSSCASPGQALTLFEYDAVEARTPTLGIMALDLPSPGSTTTIARGDFSTLRADSNDLCTVPALSPIEAGTVRYTFSNMALYVSAANPGTQLKADLTIEDSGVAPCSATYKVIGLWPQVPCTSDADCREGSGINPQLFEAVTCNPAIRACMLPGEDFVKLRGDE